MAAARFACPGCVILRLYVVGFVIRRKLVGLRYGIGERRQLHLGFNEAPQIGATRGDNEVTQEGKSAVAVTGRSDYQGNRRSPAGHFR